MIGTLIYGFVVVLFLFFGCCFVLFCFFVCLCFGVGVFCFCFVFRGGGVVCLLFFVCFLFVCFLAFLFCFVLVFWGFFFWGGGRGGERGVTCTSFETYRTDVHPLKADTKERLSSSLTFL